METEMVDFTLDPEKMTLPAAIQFLAECRCYVEETKLNENNVEKYINEIKDELKYIPPELHHKYTVDSFDTIKSSYCLLHDANEEDVKHADIMCRMMRMCYYNPIEKATTYPAFQKFWSEGGKKWGREE